MVFRSSAREALAVIGAFGTVAVATTWPLVLRLGDALPVSSSDPLLNTVILAWDADRLLHGLQGWWDLPIFHPYTNVLAFSENLLGIALFTAPIQWHYCYLPLYIFCGAQVLCARLRPSNLDGAAGVVDEVARIVGQVRQAWPSVSIVVRGDSGFCRDELLHWCEEHAVDYVIGLAKNARLKEHIAPDLAQAQAQCQETGTAARVFADFRYRTRKSWSRERRVVGKAEHLPAGANPRFVVTSLRPDTLAAQALYEDVYCARGDMENRIKEQQLALFADRTSSATLRANQLRLYWATLTGNPVVVYNLAYLGSYVLAGGGMYLLALSLTGSRPAAAVAGVLFVFVPFRAQEAGHLQSLMY